MISRADPRGAMPRSKAQRTALEAMVVRHGLFLAGIGVLSGLIAAVGLTRFLV
jgi:hypothetical protein